MSANNKIPRGLRVLVTMAILAILIWRLATNTDYFYFSIGAAIIITALIIFITYRSPRNKSKVSVNLKKKTVSESGEKENDSGSEVDNPEPDNVSADLIPIEQDILDIPPAQRGNKFTTPDSSALKPNATDIANKYVQTAKTGPYDDGGKTPSLKSIESPEATEESKEIGVPIPLIEDETILTEEEKNELVNAVWAHCENPYCKYTRFLEVHHIVDEKNGGSNKLENLIVFCPFCHDLAHRNEIPEKEMRDWTSNRNERFQFKPHWKYF